MEELILFTLVGLLGLSFGSFASLVIHRLPLNDSSINLWYPRSFCPHCKTQLSPLSIVPLLGYAINNGSCSTCKVKIHIQYIINEILGACLLMYLISTFGLINPIAWMIFAMLLCFYIQAIMDLNTLLLSQPISIILLISGLIVNIGFEFFTVIPDSILGFIFGYGLLFSINFLYKAVQKREGIGSGDFLLLSAIGATFGASSIGPILLLASSISLIVHYVNQNPEQKEIPLGFGLGLGAIIYCLIFLAIRF